MALADLPKAWIVVGGGATYGEASWDVLPSLAAPDDLSWLTEPHPKIDDVMRQYRPHPDDRKNYRARAARILAQADHLGIQLPVAFRELVLSEELQDRFPSATACYFDLPEAITPAPFGLDGHIIRFLNDQQICILWYLYLPKSGTPCVLASAPIEKADFLEELPPDDQQSVAAARDSTRIVSSTFGEFLFRYWIENSIWFKKNYKLPLTTAEADYLSHC